MRNLILTTMKLDYTTYSRVFLSKISLLLLLLLLFNQSNQIPKGLLLFLLNFQTVQLPDTHSHPLLSAVLLLFCTHTDTLTNAKTYAIGIGLPH